ncbi:MAG: nitrogen fixation protein FixH [Burkholderiales bacterium]|nr:nitrogen fixation protein FixH [Burkholderiales bacterium]
MKSATRSGPPARPAPRPGSSSPAEPQPPADRQPPASEAPLPWWRVRMVWLVLGGPLAVVIASFVTLGIALTHPDQVIDASQGSAGGEQPALQARNHAAVPRR